MAEVSGSFVQCFSSMSKVIHKIRREEEQGVHSIEVRERPKHIGIQSPLNPVWQRWGHFLFTSPPEYVCETLL